MCSVLQCTGPDESWHEIYRPLKQFLPLFPSSLSVYRPQRTVFSMNKAQESKQRSTNWRRRHLGDMQQQPHRWPGFDKSAETKLRLDVYIRPWPPAWLFLRRIYLPWQWTGKPCLCIFCIMFFRRVMQLDSSTDEPCFELLVEAIRTMRFYQSMPRNNDVWFFDFTEKRFSDVFLSCDFCEELSINETLCERLESTPSYAGTVVLRMCCWCLWCHPHGKNI